MANLMEDQTANTMQNLRGGGIIHCTTPAFQNSDGVNYTLIMQPPQHAYFKIIKSVLLITLPESSSLVERFYSFQFEIIQKYTTLTF